MLNTWYVYTKFSNNQWVFIIKDSKFNQVIMKKGYLKDRYDKYQTELYAIYYALLECKRLHENTYFTSYYNIYCSNFNMYILNWYKKFFNNENNIKLYSKTLLYQLIKFLNKIDQDITFNIDFLSLLF